MQRVWLLTIAVVALAGADTAIWLATLGADGPTGALPALRRRRRTGRDGQ